MMKQYDVGLSIAVENILLYIKYFPPGDSYTYLHICMQNILKYILPFLRLFTTKQEIHSIHF